MRRCTRRWPSAASSRELLAQHYRNGSSLSGHVSHIGVPGVELSTGSLGHGLVGGGRAWRWRPRQLGAAWRAFVLLSDGECDEGSVWEAVLFAAHHRLSNLVAVVDYNKLQSLPPRSETLDLEPFADKWRAFGWDVVEVDGHDHGALAAALTVPRGAAPGRPRCVLAHTIRARACPSWRTRCSGTTGRPSDDELAAALAELEGAP